MCPQVMIAHIIPGRSAKQCRSHYYKTPDRPATTGRWNEEEDRKLELAVEKYKRSDGRPDWVVIGNGKIIFGRTHKQCANRYYHTREGNP